MKSNNQQRHKNAGSNPGLHSAMRQSSVSSSANDPHYHQKISNSQPSHKQGNQGSNHVVSNGIQHQPKASAMTPQQQKFSSNLFHSGAAINNYLSSGARASVDTSQLQNSINLGHQQPQKGKDVAGGHQLILNQFNRANLKKSEIKQLQKYCEQNGLDFSQVIQQQQDQRAYAQQQPQYELVQQHYHQPSKSLSKERVKVGSNVQQHQQQQQQQYHQYMMVNHHGSKSNSSIGIGGSGSKSQSHRPLNKNQTTPQSQHFIAGTPTQNSNLYNGVLLHSSASTSALDRSPLNSKISQQQMVGSGAGGLQLVNFSTTSSNNGGNQPGNNHYHGVQQQQQQQFAVPTSSQSTKTGNNGGSAQQQQQQRKVTSTKMMPSQMSIGQPQQQHQQQQQYRQQDLVNQGGHISDKQQYISGGAVKVINRHPDAGQSNLNNISSASNGYLSQKASPMTTRLNNGTPATDISNMRSNSSISQPKIKNAGMKNNAANQHGVNKNLRQSNASLSKGTTSQKDLTVAYLNQKRQSQGGNNVNSSSSIDKKYQIDSGAGVIQTNGQQNNLQQRKDVYQRGIQQVEMKAAVQSRRKHGSIDTYKQSSNGHQGNQIRQGAGEIVPQRISVATQQKNQNLIYAKNSGISVNNSQLPKVVRNHQPTASQKSNISQNQQAAQQQKQQNNQNSSTPSINNSGHKAQPARLSASSPSDEIRYQSSNYTNAIRQSALSRGSIKQSSQQAFSGSNQMNLSLSQNSQRVGGVQQNLDNSDAQIQERRIAYEASQGKMSNQKSKQNSMRQSSSNEQMLRAYQQQHLQNHGVANPTVFGAADQETQKVNNIVLNQNTNTLIGTSNQRQARIRTKSNHSSIDRGQDQNVTKQQKSSKYQQDKLLLKPGQQAKRGAITAAQNSPRHTLAKLNKNQPRIPESNQEIERYYNSKVSQGAANNQVDASKKVKAMQAQSSILATKTSQQLHQQDLQQQQFAANQLRMSTEDEQLALQQHHLQIQHQNHSSSQLNQSIIQNQSRFEDSATTIEQYSRKLHTPNPILDGGTGSGGAAVTSIQHQTRQLLKEQQVILEKLGYNKPIDEPQNPKHTKYETEIPSQRQQVGKKSHNRGSSSNAAADQISQGTMSAVGTQKKSNLLAMQQNQQKLNTAGHIIDTKVINLTHHNQMIGSNVQQPKQAHTKTSAQTSNSASTVKVAHPKFLQYTGQSKNTSLNQNLQNQHQVSSSKIHMAVKLKKNASQQPSNLIMHQNAGKRSNSQEILIQQKSNNSKHVMNNQHLHNGSNQINNDVAGLHQQQQYNQALLMHNNQQNISHHQQRQKQSTNKNFEKRSSSQPTVMNHQASIEKQQQNYPKHYNEDQKKRIYYENRKLSDDPNIVSGSSGRQGVVASGATVRKSSQQQKGQLHQQSRASGDYRAAGSTENNSKMNTLHSAHGTVTHTRAAQKQHHTKIEPPKETSTSRLIIDQQSVRVSIDQTKPSASNRQRVTTKKQGGGQVQQAVNMNHVSGGMHKRLNKQSSVPQLHPNTSSGASKSTISKQSSTNVRKSQSNGPARPQYSVNQPRAIAPPHSSLGNVIDDQRLVTEDDEQEIRQVASDINEQAFYGKVIRTKKAMKVDSEFVKLSPRSQEIGYVMKKIEQSFTQISQPPITDITFYRIGKMLGRGAFGKVNLAMHKLVRKLVALKSLNKEALTDEVQKAKLMKEVNLLLKLRQNNVVKIYETIETQKHIIIVMELCAGGDLLNYVRKRRRLKEPFAQKIFKQIIDGLSYTHSKNIAHRDIKLDNILLDGKGNVKIADFGVSRQIQPDQIMREQCGTPAYIAPEILRNRGYGLNVDLWSTGVVLFAMLYGTVPFKAQTMEELHQLILKGKYLLKEDISVEARDLLRGLLEIDPKRRITIRKIYKHPWLKSMDPSVQLFNDEERKMIKKEYTYNDGSRYNRNENEEPVDCFTQHNLESQYSTLKNQESKSIILAPFNSTMSEQSPVRIDEDKQKIMEQMEVKQQVLRFSKKCREIDRQYEFNNNGQLDNGVYHKVVANNSFEQQDKFEETMGIEIEQSLADSLRNQQQRKVGKSASNARNENNVIDPSAESSFLSMAENYNMQNNRDKPIENGTVQKLVQFGYPEVYIKQKMREMHPNYCTAGYYLLEMDQNYC